MNTVASLSWRRTLMRALVIVLTAVAAATGATAYAQPSEQTGNLPDHLRKYVPGSAEWQASPWMTAETCRDRGGDFSVWTENVVSDAATLMEHFHADAYEMDPQLGQATSAGYQRIAANIDVPDGYCVDDVTRWVGADDTKPFGFSWGLDPEHQSVHSCGPADLDRTFEANLYIGAERAPCDGFYLACIHAEGDDTQACEAWNAFSDDYVRQVEDMRSQAWDEHSPVTENWAAQSVIGGWFEDLTRAIATGAASLMAEAMTFWTQTDRTGMLESPAIVRIQDMLRYVGIALLVGSIMWQGIVLVYRRKADPLVNTGLGLLSFIGWSTAGGAAAVLLNEAGIALANDVLDESIAAFATTVGDSLAGQVGVMTGAVFFLSIILFFLSVIQWIIGFFRMGALVILLALLPTAAAGQLNDATKPWLRKVLSWCLALILYQPIAAIVFAIGLQLIGEGDDLSTVLVGMSVIALAVISMPTMLRFFDWGGQRLVPSGGGGGGAAALGAAAMVASSRGAAAGFGRHMDHNGPATRGSSSESPGTGAPLVSPAIGGGDGPGNQPAAPGGAPEATIGAALGTVSSRPDGTVGEHDVTSAATGAPTGAATGNAASGSSSTNTGTSGYGTNVGRPAPDGAARLTAAPESPSSTPPPGSVPPTGAAPDTAGEQR